MADVNMIVLGPSRVGKTSLLATMYKEFAKLGVGFDFGAVGGTSGQLNEAFQKLRDVTQRDRFTEVGNLMPGTQSFLEHRFAVSFQDTTVFQIAFHDYRGGTLMKTTDSDIAELKKKVADSHVIFNILDAVALMEVDAPTSDTLNAHQRVSELLSETLKSDEKYLIVFVLVKCETYMKTASKREALLDKFEERHKAVLDLIGKLNADGKNVAGVVIPVNTLGCVEFKELVKKEGEPLPDIVFMKTQRGFAPKDVDQLLRYALSFVNHVNNNLPWWKKLSGPFNGRKPNAFRQALTNFSNGRKEYRKYGNIDLLG